MLYAFRLVFSKVEKVITVQIFVCGDSLILMSYQSFRRSELHYKGYVACDNTTKEMFFTYENHQVRF